MLEQVCAGCKYWMMNPLQPNQKPSDQMGQCRWGPPQTHVVMQQPPAPSDKERRFIELSGGRIAPLAPQSVFLTMWPSTRPEQGCGKWEKASDRSGEGLQANDSQPVDSDRASG
jgi:hypothetical protein